MIRVAHQRDVLAKIERQEVPWGIGCTARALAPGWADFDDPQLGISRNGVAVTPEHLDSPLADGDFLHYWTRPGIVIPVGSALFASIGNAVLFSIYAFLIQKLLLPAKKPVEPGDESSPTYSFSGLRSNARGEGNAIPVLYGRHRVTPPIVNEYIFNSLDENGNPVSQYRALYLISEGPINKIGNRTADGNNLTGTTRLDTLQLDGQPAENFEGVEAWVRMGNAEQEPIAEFANPVVTREVGLTMEDPLVLSHATSTTDAPTSGTAIATAGKFAAGHVNILKWTAGGETSMVSFVGQDQADEIAVVLEFPGGLIQYAADGSASPNEMLYQVRYVQVDDGGTPFGDYVVLEPRRVFLMRQGLLRAESRFRTYDPATYVAPVVGKFMESRASTTTNNPGASVSIDPTKFTAPAPASVEFSFAGWIKRRTALPTSTTVRVFTWGGALTGFKLNLFGGSVGAGLGLLVGNGASVATLNISGSSGFASGGLKTDVTNWHHIAVTWQSNFDGSGNCRARFYWDGVLRGTVIVAASAAPLWDIAQPIRLMTDSAGAPTMGNDCHLDEPTFWSKTLTQFDVSMLYNGGFPVNVDTDADGLLVGAEMEVSEQEGSSPNIGVRSFGPAAFTTAPARTWIFGSGTNAATDPIVSATAGIVKIPPLANTPKRSKWRVDVMRLDTEETSQRFVSEVSFQSIQWVTYQQFEYPGMALLAVAVRATDQLSGSPPVCSVIAEGRKVPVWDGVDPIWPNMPETYSRCPPWIFADAALNRDYGAGDIYNEQSLDVAQFQALAAHADTRIYDNGPREVLISAIQLDSADGANPTGVDAVRFRINVLPSNFPSVTTTATGEYATCKITGTPSPSVPAWLNTEIAAGAQEILAVAYDSATQDFFVYCRSSASVGASSALYTPTVSGTNFLEVERHDVRFRFDGYFDRSDADLWDSMLQILQTARSAPVRLGSRLSIFIDKNDAPVALINMASIVAGSWVSTYEDVKERYNAESAEFFDEDRNYERDVAPDRHPNQVDPTKAAGLRWRRIRLEGITRRGQVKRHLRRDLNNYHLIRRGGECECGIDQIAAQPGDVVGVSHDVAGYGFSGRIWEDASVGTSIKLDRVIVLEPAKSYQIQIENAASEVRETKPITSVAGTYQPGSSITVGGGGFSFNPNADDKYALGEVAKGEAKLFRLLDTTLNPRTMRRRLKLLEHNPDTYLDDFGTLPAASASTLTVPSAPTIPPGVENLVVSEQTAKGPDGHIRITAALSFNHLADTFSAVGSTDVYVSRGTHEQGRGMAKHVATLAPSQVSLEISEFHFARDSTYTIWVVPRTRDGATAYRAFASFIEFTPAGLGPTPEPVEDFEGAVAGEHTVYQWGSDTDHSATVELRRGGWLLGVPVASVPAQARATAPIRDWAGAPLNEQGVFQPPLVVRTKSKTGQYSEAVRYYQPFLSVASTTPALDSLVEMIEEDHDFA